MHINPTNQPSDSPTWHLYSPAIEIVAQHAVGLARAVLRDVAS